MKVKQNQHCDLPPAAVVHGWDDVRDALAPRRPVTLLSAEAAAGFAGVGWWLGLIAAARRGFPRAVFEDVLDCGDAAGVTLEALRAGQRLVRLAPCPAWALVAARAEAAGGRLLATRPQALDLARPGARRRLMAWLDGPGARDSAGGMD